MSQFRAPGKKYTLLKPSRMCRCRNFSAIKKMEARTDRTAHTCNPSTWEAETGGSRVQGQRGLHSKILSKKEGREGTERKEDSLGLE
jgi:hypothetical protein